MNAKVFQNFVLIAVIAFGSNALPAVPLGGCPTNEVATNCGLVDVSLQCEKSCNDTQVCVNVCSGLLSGVIGQVTKQCICQDGFYRNDLGLCVALDLCPHGTVNLKKRDVPQLPVAVPPVLQLPLNGCPTNEVATNCGLVDVSLQCEKSCNDTQVCVNVCSGLLGGIVGQVTKQCICQDGFYRNSLGLCVALDLCAHATVNLKKRDVPQLPVVVPPVALPSLNGCPTNEVAPNCGLLDVSLQCEKNCNDTKVCVNVCSGLLGGVIGQVTKQCICQDGFYRDNLGLCVALDLCAHGTVNA